MLLIINVYSLIEVELSYKSRELNISSMSWRNLTTLLINESYRLYEIDLSVIKTEWFRIWSLHAVDLYDNQRNIHENKNSELYFCRLYKSFKLT